MIKLQELITGIRNAIDEATQQSALHNISIFRSFFDEKKRPANSKKVSTDGSSGDTSSGSSGGTPGGGSGGSGGSTDGAGEVTVWTPKPVIMEFMKDSSDGAVAHQASVPLISLVPFTAIQPSEVLLEVDLELIQHNGELQAHFPTSKRSLTGQKVSQNKPNAKLTIRMDTTSRPAGLDAVIEGYDRNLRARIPT